MRGFVGADVADHELHVAEAFLMVFDGFQDAQAVGVGGIDGDDVHFAAHQFLSAFEEVASGSDGGACPQAALVVFGGVGVLQLLLNILDRDQALEVVLIVDHEQLFDAVPVQDFLGFVEGGADGDGDEVIFGHHLRNREVEAGFEAQIAVGENADQFAFAGDRDAGDAVALHERRARRRFSCPGRW